MIAPTFRLWVEIFAIYFFGTVLLVMLVPVVGYAVVHADSFTSGNFWSWEALTASISPQAWVRYFVFGVTAGLFTGGPLAWQNWLASQRPPLVYAALAFGTLVVPVLVLAAATLYWRHQLVGVLVGLLNDTARF
ncbi:hypothetical protein [Ramlibacter rhizophilus]|uniref:Uncharacterized protein n=1 Tax=Ramlibacter rhizophilus TaxID=1781167 RepID=A0A4Z0BQC0_9BURK|nr:hypothetical protein [Ramlibacter rhizophilus]TFZ01041.1 hypothetical protein EZ242_06500 [Ramlibacter rhizophilus]